MLLVDTSAWIELFHRPPRLAIEDLGGLDAIVICLPVLQEVLQGFRDERAFRVAREAMMALPIVESPLHSVVVEEAVALFRSARRTRRTIRSSVDCLIAAPRACPPRHPTRQ